MKILLLETIHDEARRLLAPLGELMAAERLDADYLFAVISDADAALTRGRGRLPRAVLAAGRRLRCVARCGVGTDNIDVAAATELGLPVIYAPGSTTTAVAEHTLMLMLALARRVVVLNHRVKSGDWAFRERAGLAGELSGKTLGILGLGHIGRRVAELAQAFAMDVIYWSPQSRDERFQYVERDALMRRADVVSIHLALTPETRGLVDASAIASMKRGAMVINTGRGEIIDEDALVGALQSGALGGAGLDVITADAPHRDHPLWRLENVVVTPHVAALTDIAFRRMCMTTAEQVARILRGDPPDARFVRNPAVLSGRSV